MAPKPGNYAILEALQQEFRNDPHLTMLYEYQRPTSVSPTGTVIDLFKEFGPVRIPDWVHSTKNGSSVVAPVWP